MPTVPLMPVGTPQWIITGLGAIVLAFFFITQLTTFIDGRRLRKQQVANVPAMDKINKELSSNPDPRSDRSVKDQVGTLVTKVENIDTRVIQIERDRIKDRLQILRIDRDLNRKIIHDGNGRLHESALFKEAQNTKEVLEREISELEMQQAKMEIEEWSKTEGPLE
jgi:hypothetical protein